jgi:uncharacterized protein (TIGR00299 family) protein
LKVAFFDCEFGAGGDMLNAALLAAGASLEHLASELAKLNFPDGAYEISTTNSIHCGVKCNQFNVLLGPEKIYESNLHIVEEAVACKVNENESREREHRVHNEKVWTKGAADQEPKRRLCSGTLDGITELLDGSALSPGVKQKSKVVFQLLYESQSLAAGTAVENLNMNEISAIDSVIDIVSFAVSCEYLQLEKLFVSPLPLGSGAFEYAGEMRFAADPSILEMLKKVGARVSSRELPCQCLTPTAAAILAALSNGWQKPSFNHIDSIGYGGGSYNPTSYPNVCRVLVGETERSESSNSRFIHESIHVLEANIDDLSPQSLAYATEQLFSAGALDVIVLPAVMKKGRSGHVLKILCQPEDRERMQGIVFNETTTIGIRSYEAERVIADRKWQSITLDDGTEIRIKTAFDQNGNLMHAQPEYDDCAVYAARHQIPLKGVIDVALARFRSENKHV